MQSTAARASLMGGKQPQSRKTIRVRHFRVAPDSLVLQSFPWKDLFGLNLWIFFSFFFASQSTGTSASLGLFLSCSQTKKLLATESIR